MKPFFLFPLLLSASAPAQGYIEVPKWNRTKGAYEGPDYFIVPRVNDVPIHVQYAYDVWDFGRPAAWLTGVAFRPQMGIYDMPAVTIRTTVTLSHAACLPTNLSSVFAQNMGNDRSTVFDSSTSWPAYRKNQPSQFVASIPFRKPFLFTVGKGKSLVMDVRSASSTLSPNQGWYCAMAVRDVGRVTFNGPRVDCWRQPHGGGYGPLIPGGTLAKTWYSLPPTTTCFSSLGDAGARSKWGGRTLPIPLGSGCWWSNRPSLFLVFLTDSNGGGVAPSIPIPNQPSVVGLTLFDQDGCLAPSYNALGFITLFSSELRVGTGHAPNAGTIFSLRDLPARRTGSAMKTRHVTIARFSYR